MLDTLRKRKLKSVLFVCGKRVDSDEGKHLISAWDLAGHEIGNHSYSHLYFNETPDERQRLRHNPVAVRGRRP